MKNYSGGMKIIGGAGLFLTAMASDGGQLSLTATFLLAGLSVLLLAAGELFSRPRKRRAAFRPAGQKQALVSARPAA